MTSRHSGRPRWPSSARAVTGIVLLLAPLCGIGTARASDLLGIYFGASYGQAHVRAQQPDTTITLNDGTAVADALQPLGGLDGTHSAFKGMLGIRLLSFLGAEVSYMDFGSVSTLVGQGLPGTPAIVVNTEQASQKGEAAFALLYLPVPVVDVYVKAGLSRITTDFSAAYTQTIGGLCGLPCTSTTQPGSLTHDTTDTAFAYGAGLQWKLGQWAVRGEYERFSAAGANPSLASVGMTYWLHID